MADILIFALFAVASFSAFAYTWQGNVYATIASIIAAVLAALFFAL